MSTNSSMASVMMNAGPVFGPLLGIGGGVTALAVIPNPEAKLFTCAMLFALAAGSALRKLCFAAPVREELADYPFSTHTANPWERDGGPAGL